MSSPHGTDIKKINVDIFMSPYSPTKVITFQPTVKSKRYVKVQSLNSKPEGYFPNVPTHCFVTQVRTGNSVSIGRIPILMINRPKRTLLTTTQLT